VNPLPAASADAGEPRRGHGLCGLRERVGALGGLLDHRRSGEEFRLFAMLPLAAAAEAPVPPAVGPDGLPEAVAGGSAGSGHVPAAAGAEAAVPYRTGGVRHQVPARLVGAALATLLFVVL